ncbi:MAG: phospholipid carrier-dependent glycosyltransferase [Kiritimatiellae bacterium]|nr:phospholipid carrier-dependent glycosyltransferase [Kiritimatiellia bacterium]MDD5521577.1 phospholipid carrier-dependent glycosyltransferase [Kiritimatiellia bacterium]
MKSFLAVILLVVIVYILPLNVRPLAMPDETRYAEIPREMIASGDWIVPRLNGIRYFEKPAMGYWLTGICIKLFGEYPFSIRLPSVLTTGISALALLLFVRRITGRDSFAFLAAVIFLTSIEVFAIGTFAVLDAPLSLFITLIMIFFFMAYSELSPLRQRIFLVLCGVFCGAAFLIKGFLAFAIPCVSIVPFLFIEKRLKDVFRFGFIPLIAAVLVTLPWVILIHIREPDYWRYFFWVEHVQRFFAHASHAQHPETIWFFIPVILLGFIPWTFVIPAAIKGLRDENENTTLLRFVLCWIIFPFIMLSVSKGKLATYILPLYPPMAIAISLGLVSYLKRNSVPAFKKGAIISTFFGLIIIGVLIFGQKIGFKSIDVFAPGEEHKLVLAVVAACSWTTISLVSAVIRHRFASLTIYAAATLVLLIVAPFVLPDRVLHDKRYLPETLIQRNIDKIQPDSHIFSDAEDTPAICWTLKRSDVTILDSTGEFAYGLKYEDSKHRLINHKDLRRKIKKGIPGKNILIDETNDISEFLESLPKPLFKDIENAFLFAQF